MLVVSVFAEPTGAGGLVQRVLLSVLFSWAILAAFGIRTRAITGTAPT